MFEPNVLTEFCKNLKINKHLLRKYSIAQPITSILEENVFSCMISILTNQCPAAMECFMQITEIK